MQLYSRGDRWRPWSSGCSGKNITRLLGQPPQPLPLPLLEFEEGRVLDILVELSRASTCSSIWIGILDNLEKTVFRFERSITVKNWSFATRIASVQAR